MLKRCAVATSLIALLVLATLPNNSQAEVVNMVTAWLYPGATDAQAVVQVWVHNPQPLRAMGFPFKFAASDSIKLDSLDFEQGRARFFSTKIPNYDPVNNTLLVNLFNRSRDMTAAGRSQPLPVGEGEIFRLFFTAPNGKFPHKSFDMAPIILPPENRLIFVTDSILTVYPTYDLKKAKPPVGKAARKKGKKGRAQG